MDPTRRLHEPHQLRGMDKATLEFPDQRRGIQSCRWTRERQRSHQVNTQSDKKTWDSVFFSRVATPLAYFISDQLYTPIGGLTDTRSIPLHVVTLPVLEQALSQNSGQKLLPGQQSAGHVRYSVGQQLAGQQLAGQQSVGQCDVSDQDSVVTRERDIPLVLPLRKKSKMEPVIQPQLPSSSSSSSPSSPSSSSPNCSPKLTRAVGVVCEALGTPTGSWILDIDLDFFSTANPFNKEFSQVRAIKSYVMSNNREQFYFLCISLVNMSLFVGGIHIFREAVQISRTSK